jgi:hypothetical protein
MIIQLNEQQIVCTKKIKSIPVRYPVIGLDNGIIFDKPMDMVTTQLYINQYNEMLQRGALFFKFNYE